MYPKGSGHGVLCDGPCEFEHEEVFSVEVGEVPTGVTALVINESDEIVNVMPLTRPVIVTMCRACLERLLPQHVPSSADAAA